MALADRPIVRRVLREAEERLGVTVVPVRERERLAVMEQEFEEFRNEAEELAWHVYDYWGNRPHEMRPERRRRMAQRSRIALQQDPLAGAEAQLLGDFAFGKGINMPAAREPKVQKVIERTWTDSINQQILTSYQAQRKLSNELLNAGELFMSEYIRGGRLRVGRRSADLVIDVVPDPENEHIPLWYVIRERRFEWDFDTDRPKFTSPLLDGKPQVKYWAHWRNVEDAKADRETDEPGPDEQPLEEPPADKLAEGVIYHVAINQTGEQLRGNPPWARSLRFMSAMNVLTEAHVTMAQAASTFIARREVQGSPNQVTKAATSILSMAGELGASTLRSLGNAEPTTEPFARADTEGPFPPGSWWTENQTSKLEALALNSGAAQMTQTAQIVRAPLAASSGFGQHYLGDAQNANLATASTLELPSTMHVGAWQQSFEDLFRHFTDRGIEAAVKAGEFGGIIVPDGEQPLGEMNIQEAEDRAAMEKRTGIDLSYEFSMPFPGRRQLADVVTVVQNVSQSMDPNGVNIPLRRILLRFLFEQIGIDDVSHAVEESIPEKGVPGGIGPQATGAAAGAGGFGPGAGAPAPSGGAGTGASNGAAANDPPAGQQPYGAKSGTAAGGGSAGADGSLEGLEDDIASWLGEGAAASVEDLEAQTAKLFREIVLSPENRAALGLTANGSS